MKVRRAQPARFGLYLFAALWLLVLVPMSARAAPYAAFVMDARTGEVLHSRNADTRLHPASLTKMMTLYIAFEAIERGELTLDTKVKISKNAASEPPSKLGLNSGQTIAFRYLIRAAAVKSANDAATAIGEAISGSEAKFARRMNRTAKALGMTRTTFKNAHGLTETGHMSTARDMSMLGRRVLYDYPQYYNLFSRTTTDAGVRKVNNTNRRLLAAYKGADGIKTGYTRAAGFNLVSSAKRGNERVIATVFGGTSTPARNARIAELLDLGFKRAPSRAPVRDLSTPVYADVEDAPEQPSTNPGSVKGGKGKTIRLVGAIKKSLRPQSRPDEPVEVLVAEAKPEATSELTTATDTDVSNALLSAGINAALLEATQTEAPKATSKPASGVVTLASVTVLRPPTRPRGFVLVGSQPAPKKPAAAQEVVSRVSTSGGRHWGVNIGRFPSRHDAESKLLKTALSEMATLDGSLRKVVKRPTGFDANFLGMTRDMADLACRRLQARNQSCFMIGPG